MNLRIELEQEQDGRWIAEVVELPGVMAYGSTAHEALARVQALAPGSSPTVSSMARPDPTW